LWEITRGEMAIPFTLLTLTLSSETSFTTTLAAKVLAIFTDLIKPRLTVSEARHRLAPNEGQKENRNLGKNKRLDKMKKNTFRVSAVLSILFSATILATLMLPIVQSIDTYGHMDVNEYWWGATASRCDHLVDPPGADAYNAFTGCGLVAYNQSDAWINCTYYFMRGFGGPDQFPHTWCCSGYDMMCGHKVDYTTTYYYDPFQPYWRADGGPQDQWPGYYQPLRTIVRTGLDAEQVGIITASYFKNYSIPHTPVIYISSIIPSYYLVAGSVIETDYEW
jgi:hypothetical protein